MHQDGGKCSIFFARSKWNRGKNSFHVFFVVAGFLPQSLLAHIQGHKRACFPLRQVRERESHRDTDIERGRDGGYYRPEIILENCFAQYILDTEILVQSEDLDKSALSLLFKPLSMNS